MDDSNYNTWDLSNVNLTDVLASPDGPAQLVCLVNAGGNEYNGSLGARISSIFVVLFVSSAVTFFPVIAARSRRVEIPRWIYMGARYFGSGVIVTTAFVHLLDPAYGEIGPNTCVGMTGGWAGYSWPPAIALASCMFVFILEVAAERFVSIKYGLNMGMAATQAQQAPPPAHEHHGSDHEQSAAALKEKDIETLSLGSQDESVATNAFREQIAAFLILEFGVIFHSVIIGLTLGSAGPEFSTLYPVIVFHQSFEGLGIGARLSAIPFPKRWTWLAYFLCAGYGLTTPISIAIGVGLGKVYDGDSFTANVVSGILDSISAGILFYTGLVELLARDFIFNPHPENRPKVITAYVVCVLFGAGIMALLGKWA